MLKLFNKKKKDNKGFTLVELVIVIAILAILVGLLAPQYTKYVEKSRKAADASNLDNIVTGIKVAAADPDYDIDAATYKIVMTTTNTTITETLDNGVTAATKNTWKNALKEYTGYTVSDNGVLGDLKLKSKKWIGGPTDADSKEQGAIGATVKVDKDGAVTVDYQPTDVKETSKTK